MGETFVKDLAETVRKCTLLVGQKVMLAVLALLLLLDGRFMVGAKALGRV